MNPSFRCPSCSTRFRAEEKYVGRRVRCPREECGTSFVLTLDSSESGKVESSVQSSKPVIAASTVPQRSMSAEKKPVAQRRATPASAAKPVAAKQFSAKGEASSVVGPPKVTTGARSAADKSSRRSGSAARSLQDSRYESGSSMMPLFVGFAATALFGGLGLGAYWYSSQPDESVFAASSDEAAGNGNSSPSFAGNAVTSERASSGDIASAGQTAPAAESPGSTAAELGATRLTSAVSGAVLRRNAERQQVLEEKILPFLTKHCADCHNADEQEGGIAVHDLTAVDQLLKDRKKWERVYRMINASAMPPASYDPKPEESSRQEVADILYGELFDFDCEQLHHAGRATLHRLNRAEYNNTIRDLFGVSITPADKFPQDDVGEGFDNIGDVLSLPPLLMEKYLDAAEEVAAAVIDTRDFSKGMTQKFASDKFDSSLKGSIDGEGFYILHTNGTLTVNHDTLSEGKYRIRIEAMQMPAGDGPSKMALQVDGQPVQEFEVKGRRKGGWFEHDVTLTAGKHAIAAVFTNDFYDENAPEGKRDRNLGVRAIEVTGPEGGGPAQWHETHRRIVTAQPSSSLSVKDAAKAVLRPLLYRSFRRPVTDPEVERFADLVDQTVSVHQESYEYGMYVALQAILVSPDFLFRKEADPEGDARERSLNEYEVASRLSYFLWSSMPDEELFQLAENKRLFDSTILRGQIERMLKHEKAAALGQNFASQWLNLRNLADVRPNPDVFPDFDDALRAAMGRETILLFNTIVREDRSIDEFLGADYSYVNERLAKHYGIEGVTGEEFVRVSLEGTNRAGVLTHASVLTLTSNPGRTSPVKRGKWILENILGDAPPPAPPGVPPLAEEAKDLKGLSLRERLEQHRSDPGCASCHKAMDPLGMGLENFDAVGRWRDQEAEKPIDASGDLPTGEKFAGPAEMMSIIRGRQEKFSRTFTERLMVYALGRGLEYYDKCAVDQTTDLMKERGNRFSALVEGIVTSDPFMKKSRTRETEPSVTQ
jgi:hypothetical protein